MKIVQKIGLIVGAIGLTMFLIQSRLAIWFPMLDLTSFLPASMIGNAPLFFTYILLLSVIAAGIGIFFIGFKEKREASVDV